MKKLTALALSIMMLLSLTLGTTVSAATYVPEQTETAETLYSLGLFKGRGKTAEGLPNYDLASKATRLEGIVMLLRLLGEEEEALNYTGECQFTDVPEWGQPYAAYAASKGYTKGTSRTTFGSDQELIGKMFLTFVIRALGYSDSKDVADFAYDTANDFAEEIGLIEEGTCTDALYRDETVAIMKSALNEPLKGTETELIWKLVDDGVLNEGDVQLSGILTSEEPSEPTEPVPPTLGSAVQVPVDKRSSGGSGLTLKDVQSVFPEAVFLAAGGSPDTTKALHDYPASMLTRTPIFRKYLAGLTSTLPSIESAYDSVDFGWPSAGLVTVMDKDYNLIAYGVVTPQEYKADTITLYACFFEGRPELERVRNIIRNVQPFDINAVYLDVTTTIDTDTEEEESIGVLRLQENRLPASLQGRVAYYDICNATEPATDLYQAQIQTRRLFSVIQGGSIRRFDVDTWPGNVNFGNKSMLCLYDANHDLLGYSPISDTFPIVETIVEK